MLLYNEYKLGGKLASTAAHGGNMKTLNTIVKQAIPGTS